MTIPARPHDLRTLGKALRAARQRTSGGITLDALAAATGISKPYLSNIETGRAPGPASEEKLRAIAKALHLNAGELLAAADWLRTPASVRRAILGESPRRADGAIDLDRALQRDASPETPRDSRVAAPPAAGPAALPLRQVPLINRVAAGKPGEFGDLSYPAGVADAYVAAPDLPETPTAALFAVRVEGDSMLPEYRAGDILIVGPGEPRDGDDCVVRTGELEDFATTFKRVFFLRDADGAATAARLVPLNPAHPERVVKLEEVTGIYPLVYRLVPGRGNAPRGPGARASEKLKGLFD
jgi:repressor LexA